MAHKPIEISYVRVSTDSTNQLTSIGNQINTLKKYNNKCKIIVHKGSGSTELNSDLKDTIINLSNKKKTIKLNIVAFDRLTRNYKDLDFIKQYIKYIHIVPEDKTYDLELDLPYIVEKVTESIQELKNIQQRCIRESNKRDSTKRLKSRYEKQLNTDKRCRETENNIIIFGIEDDIVTPLKKFIHLSQNLCSKNDWLELFGLISEFGLDAMQLRREYLHDINRYGKKKSNDEMPIFKLEKKIVIRIVNDVLSKNKLTCDKVVLNGFLNSHYNRAKDFDPEEDSKQAFDKDMVNILSSLSVSKDELKKFINIAAMMANK